MEIVPSIIAATQKELDMRLGSVIRFANSFHLDFMDGEFVPNRSLDFDFRLPKAKYEAHLMVKNPLAWLDKLENIDIVIFHFESQEVEEAIDKAKNKGMKVCLALNPGTRMEQAFEYMSKIDKVLVMTVEPGVYGGNFLPEMLGKIRKLRNSYPDMPIEVDGGVDPSTIKKLKEAGANFFVSGSYIQKNPKGIEEMKKLIEN